MFINIHSHQPATGTQLVIENKYRHFNTLQPNRYYSAGLHPWYITEADYNTGMQQLQLISRNSNVLAIGECGLDKICSVDFKLQQQLFAAQIDLANTVHKPLLIHCVRAFAELQQLLQQHHNAVPVIFHGFNKNAVLAQQLVAKGFYLSFGKALQRPALQQLITTLPADKIFFETDDAGIDIETIYSIAARSLQIDINSLSLQIQKNAVTVFGAACM